MYVKDYGKTHVHINIFKYIDNLRLRILKYELRTRYQTKNRNTSETEMLAGFNNATKTQRINRFCTRMACWRGYEHGWMYYFRMVHIF